VDKSAEDAAQLDGEAQLGFRLIVDELSLLTVLSILLPSKCGEGLLWVFRGGSHDLVEWSAPMGGTPEVDILQAECFGFVIGGNDNGVVDIGMSIVLSPLH